MTSTPHALLSSTCVMSAPPYPGLDLPIESHALSTAGSAPLVKLIDYALLRRVVTTAWTKLRLLASTFELLPADRFFVGILPVDDDDSGGFHSRHSRGFNHLRNYGLGVLISTRYGSNAALRTLEIARSYIHDSIHYSSHRTYRSREHDPTAPVYRA